MRLVSIESLLERKSLLYGSKCITQEEFEALIKSEPMAYDVEQVKKRLRNATKTMMPVVPIQEALDIVDGGYTKISCYDYEDKSGEFLAKSLGGDKIQLGLPKADYPNPFLLEEEYEKS